MLLLLPILLAIAAAVRLTSKGPAFYRQERAGLDGLTFVVLKFRTMVDDAETHLKRDRELARRFSEHRKLLDDPRVTSLGRFLRRTSLDELPQLWNVLVGDMSVVGPRPVPLDELHAMYGPAAADVVAVKPGLTGLWQVSGRSDLSYAERVALDLQYVRQKSLLLDLQIIARTPVAVLAMRGAI